MKSITLLFCLVLMGWVHEMQGQSQRAFIISFDINYTDSIQLSHPTILSDFNSNQYTANAACFLDEIIVICNSEDASRTNIWTLHQKSMQCQALTNTGIDEHMAAYWPSRNGFLCLINNTLDTNRNEHVLWFYPEDKKNRGHLVYESEMHILSFEPINNNEIAVLLDNKTNQLAILNVSKNQLNVFSSNVAPGILFRDSLLYFIHEGISHTRTLKAYNKKRKQATKLFQLQDSMACFVLAEDNNWLLNENTRIFAISDDGKNHWDEILDLAIYGVDFIDKMVICNGRLIVSVRSQ